MSELTRPSVDPPPPPTYLHKFRLYETTSKFYMIGRDKNRMFWKVLKIDRLDPSELTIIEDSTTYSEPECCDLLRRIHEGNRSTGGLKFVTTCYGIVGFVKFLGPYYMLLITRRNKIGTICGKTIYDVSRSEMITVQSSSVQYNEAYSKNEKRYKKLLSTVDLTKDFFFSYSYNIMNSLQKNLTNERGQSHYESMFVWNEFLTRRIRNNLNNTMWTVALVYGFFKQKRKELAAKALFSFPNFVAPIGLRGDAFCHVKISVFGRDFKLTLIARRSRHYAGTRYLKRGVNEKGRVANDVETEQILFEDVPEAQPMQISSVVQMRGSIPLFWSQETSRLNIKPDITLSKHDPNYNATKLHFENLIKRYGSPIIILNLIKTREKKPRETILRAEFSNAIRYLNKTCFTEENRLRKALNALTLLGKVAAYAVNLSGIFYCHIPASTRPGGLSTWSIVGKNDSGGSSFSDSEHVDSEVSTNKSSSIGNVMFQNGVLRTNCIDCLDRTNVAQYTYGLVALGQQLHAFGFTDSPSIDLDNPLAEELMRLYEHMGDTLALQYGGSAAHNKIFCERRGQWKAATQSQEFFRTLQRYYSNAYMDGEKQDAINVFLGHFQPQEDKPALWELDSDQHYKVGTNLYDEGDRPFIKRSLSAGNIQCGSDTLLGSSRHDHAFPEISEDVPKISGSTPDVSACGAGISYSRYAPSMSTRRHFRDMLFEGDHVCEDNHEDGCYCTNFLDLDMLSSSANSCDDDIINDRSITGSSYDKVANEFKIDSTTSASDAASSLKLSEQNGSQVTCYDTIADFPDTFVTWVTHGGMFCS
ncbi:hypothetical protein ACFE04_021767 [Oxalis oulophora]